MRRPMRPVEVLILAALVLPPSLVAQDGEPAADDAAPAEEAVEEVPPAPFGDLERGVALYVQLCTGCHGDTGRGDGDLAPLLDPRPRDFGLARFHVVSTGNGLPSDQDLLDTIKLGMVGTAMPGWSHLPEEDLRALVTCVRTITERRVLEERLKARDEDESVVDVTAEVREEMTPGPTVSVGAAPPSTPELLARGREVWAASCAECHGADGRGDGRADLRNDLGAPSPARDMTRGLFRGTAEPVELARRIVLGMPGTAMPAFDLPEDDLWAVVHHTRSLVPQGAQEEMLQVRRTVVAPRVDGGLDGRTLSPVGADGSTWDNVPELRLPLMPFVSYEAPAAILRVQAVHDGDRLAVRVRWEETPPASMNGDAHPELTLKLTTAVEPPIMTRNEDMRTMRSWRWRAERAGGSTGKDGDGYGVSRGDDAWEVVFVDDPGRAPDGEAFLRTGRPLRLQLVLRPGGGATRALTMWHAFEVRP